jgi:hypothetical protein
MSELPSMSNVPPTPADSFDRERVLTLLDRLERDIAVVEAAMVHVEAGEHESFDAAVAVLQPGLPS